MLIDLSSVNIESAVASRAKKKRAKFTKQALRDVFPWPLFAVGYARQMPGSRRLPHERAIIFAAAMGDLPIEQVNELLLAVKARKIPPSSYKMVLDTYAPKFRKDPALLGANIDHPSPISHLDD